MSEPQIAAPSSTPQTTPAPDRARSYDLALRTCESGLFTRDRGIKLSNAGIGWTFDGHADEAPFENVVEVHLQTGGAPDAVLGICRIQFETGYFISVNSSRPLSVSHETQSALYRDFVRDLHRRLATHGPSSVKFSAGYEVGKFWVVLACTALLGLMAVVIPLVFLVVITNIAAVALLVAGAIFLWPFVRMIQANIGRRYDPRHIPDDLLP
jgi:hypothetical protein